MRSSASNEPVALALPVHVHPRVLLELVLQHVVAVPLGGDRVGRDRLDHVIDEELQLRDACRLVDGWTWSVDDVSPDVL